MCEVSLDITHRIVIRFSVYLQSPSAVGEKRKMIDFN